MTEWAGRGGAGTALTCRGRCPLMWRLYFWHVNGIQTNFCAVSVAYGRMNLGAHLDWEADRDEEEVRGGEAGQERVGGRLEGGLPHDGQDDQHVARHPQTEGEAAT